MSLISIVVPVYYNESSLPLLWERLNQVTERQPDHAFEFGWTMAQEMSHCV